MSNDDVSPFGSPIYHHQPRGDTPQPAPTDVEAAERIEQHITQHIGKPDMVWHELISDLVHIDIHMIPPRSNRDFYTLITSGMSDLPMTVPPGREEYRYAEMMISLPKDWPLTQEAFNNEANYWPIRWLKMLARLPHEYNTWLGAYHTIPNGDPAAPFASNTRLCCALIFVPLLVGEEFEKLKITPTKTINFYSMIPIYREEMELKMNQGGEALIECLDAAGVSELLDIIRANTCT